MAEPPARTPLWQRLVAAVFVAAFFAALPFWFLSTQDGPVDFVCGGAPWQCEVTHRWLWRTRVVHVEPTLVRTVSHVLSRRGSGVTEWQLVFETKDGELDVLDSPSTDEDVGRLATQLEAARASGDHFVRTLAPDATYFVALGLVALFAVAGAGLVLLAEGRGPRPRD